MKSRANGSDFRSEQHKQVAEEKKANRYKDRQACKRGKSRWAGRRRHKPRAHASLALLPKESTAGSTRSRCGGLDDWGVGQPRWWEQTCVWGESNQQTSNIMVSWHQGAQNYGVICRLC